MTQGLSFLWTLFCLPEGVVFETRDGQVLLRGGWREVALHTEAMREMRGLQITVGSCRGLGIKELTAGNNSNSNTCHLSFLVIDCSQSFAQTQRSLAHPSPRGSVGNHCHCNAAHLLSSSDRVVFYCVFRNQLNITTQNYKLTKVSYIICAYIIHEYLYAVLH